MQCKSRRINPLCSSRGVECEQNMKYIKLESQLATKGRDEAALNGAIVFAKHKTALSISFLSAAPGTLASSTTVLQLYYCTLHTLQAAHAVHITYCNTYITFITYGAYWRAVAADCAPVYYTFYLFLNLYENTLTNTNAKKSNLKLSVPNNTVKYQIDLLYMNERR